MFSELQHRLIFAGNEPEKVDLMLKSFTARMPCKEIIVNGELYLRRYFVCEHRDGLGNPSGQEWIHQFLSQDGDRHLHSHPWHAVSRILLGGYSEEYMDDGEKKVRTLTAGDENIISPDHIHRIAEVAPYTWTHMTVGQSRLSQWFFVDDAGTKEFVKSSESDWWKDCKPRGTRNG